MIARDHQVNAHDVEVDEKCVELLALHQPAAGELRFITTAMKIVTDLERIGDQAVNIAYNTKDYLEGEPVKDLVDIPIMANEVRAMVRDSLDSFVRQDPALAREVLKRDDVVDNLKDKVFTDLISFMTKNSQMVEQALDLILIARNLERLGDHATNIAEDVIFWVRGADVRHVGAVQP